MGIRHLITFLRPYATTLESLGGHKVVIDGPSFAHQIYYICLQASPGAKNALEAAPSYRELVNVAIAWLDGLRESNVQIMKIYFDGFLPPGKLEVRLKRLRENTNRLSNFHVAYKEQCRDFSPDNAMPQCLELFRNRSVPSCLTTLPALPFVVPAILEALNASSTYRGVTETVPGEADLYCANHLKKYGGIVLTSDSDLLVHGLGSKGAVSFFGDIAPVGNDEPDQLRTQWFSPADLSIRLGLPKSHGLTSLAFEMHIDPHGSFQNLLSKARSLKAVTEQPQIFQDFLKEYTEVPDEPIISAEHAGTVQALRSLDPRTSEYVLQFNSLALISGQPPVSRQATSVSPHVFLPFLLDCPVRTTAWEVSSAVRQLAYGLVNLIVPDDEQVSWVFEHRKQIDQSKGRGLNVASLSEVPGACLYLIERFERLRLKLLNLKESEVWIAVALQQDIESSHSNSKTPSIQLFIQAWGKLECSDVKGSFSWDVVHFFAQLQATLFSLRMLKQTSNIVIATRSTKIPDSLLRLNQLLDSLPALIEYPNNRSAASISRKSETATFLAFIKRVLTALDYDCQPRVCLPAAKENKASKKKRKREAAATDTPVSKIRSNNPFDVLGDDW
ncbi:DNA replication initiation factor cdc45 [Drepanopeziza brunnea f. sp. 'multigermtubi' MB_m1]|uniref:DNA replication initiation factor cdc45 n=1 Tax=Marssonina brunnea f. sp. multigermtubi (strain MB_m1) TaxID=1072389 RepID=K1X8N6_MARBU|nr:DNA replication initiation factor cdc45 [Drepanopeziza brunnea f. sp. 'multigermtubi' MB_m1]EKD21432.1 DNA replication initiation factor cdc45 [Drepanopeziza brunnea f. sp. 'multigermtubi' MB_m1]